MGDDLTPIREALTAATPGPWFVEYEGDERGGVLVVGSGDFDDLYERLADVQLHFHADAALIVLLRNNAADLLARVDTAEARIAELEAEVKAADRQRQVAVSVAVHAADALAALAGNFTEPGHILAALPDDPIAVAVLRAREVLAR